MDLGYHIIICFTLAFFWQEYEASDQIMRPKSLTAYANIIKSWVDKQDHDKNCFGLIVESKTIEPGTKKNPKNQLALKKLI